MSLALFDVGNRRVEAAPVHPDRHFRAVVNVPCIRHERARVPLRRDRVAASQRCEWAYRLECARRSRNPMTRASQLQFRIFLKKKIWTER